MLDRQLVIGTRDRAFQQAPDVLNTVRIDTITNIFIGAVIDNLMLRVGISNASVVFANRRYF